MLVRNGLSLLPFWIKLYNNFFNLLFFKTIISLNFNRDPLQISGSAVLPRVQINAKEK